jgi:hypothetical protein
LEYSENIKRLLSNLPFHLHDRWINVVFRIKDSQKTHSTRNKANSSSNFVSVFRIVGHSKAFLINADAITSVSP